jgi:BirA family biotin operon repressor/biotin-[acetyl-CoA-carboxylase] ligase
MAIGTGGKRWHSIKDNLALSVSFIVDSQEKVKLLPFVAAMSLHQLLSNMAIHSNIKWPNDILIDRKKIAGILVQSYSNILNTDSKKIGICLGIGMNVNAVKQDLENLSQAATSIFIETSIKHDVKEFSKNLGIMLIENIQSFMDNKMPNLISQVNEKLEKFDNKLITLQLTEDLFEKGIIKKVNIDGSINLRMPDGLEKSFDYGRISLT